jgi:hypothetical protein
VRAALDIERSTIMGYSWQPKSSIDLVRVKVLVPAWSGQPNSIVVALFVNQFIVANKSSRRNSLPEKLPRRCSNSKWSQPASTGPIGLDVRVGPGRPGVIYLNGDANGADRQMAKPKLTIEEIARSVPIRERQRTLRTIVSKITGCFS